MNVWHHLLYLLRRLHLRLQWVPAGIGPAPDTDDSWRPPRFVANSGGPRSRVVATPLVSRMLSDGSDTLGLRPVRTCRLPRQKRTNQLRAFVHKLLHSAGFQTPEQAWEFHADQLPGDNALVVDADPGPDTTASGRDPASLLRNALILGKCSGSLFSPTRPIIWSERRLARSVKLVHCDGETFYRNDD